MDKKTGKTTVTLHSFPVTGKTDNVAGLTGLPDKVHLLAELQKKPQSKPYPEGRLIVVYRDGVVGTRDSISVPIRALGAMRGAGQRRSLTPPFTNNSAVNALLSSFGVDKAEHLFTKFGPGLTSMARRAPGQSNFNVANTYRLHITGTSVRYAVEKLLHSPAVVFASPDYFVTSLRTQDIRLPDSLVERSRVARSAVMTRAVPSNYALATSAQSMLNAPANDAATAFDEIQHTFHQLPGQGEIITNVSIGDLTDHQTDNDPNDSCRYYGETTHVIGGQRYIDWPSMPLIAAYSSDPSGNLSGSAEVCGVDNGLGEVGLDFSMMAPLPNILQRSGEVGSGLTDLLGIAPGAKYRLVVPRIPNYYGVYVTESDIDGSFIAAGLQDPRPNVITASLGFPEDVFGFPGRYLEDDPLTHAIISSLVENFGIVVCISSNDGLRTYTNAAVSPSGGSAATDVIPNGGMPSMLQDVGFSTAPSHDFDSGAIDVGGTTLDDIFAAPPQNPAYSHGPLGAQHAFAETRWTGFTNFSSGYGSRVNVSAPADNVLSFSSYPDKYDHVVVNLSGGTSASAPEVAAAAAVALQVARLTGHPFPSPVELRTFLAQTANPVPNVPQADQILHVGPQVNVRRIVETLLTRSGRTLVPGVARVAVEQRRFYGNLDGAFLSATDPTNIDLQGPVSSSDGSNTGRNQTAWITIAPDWEGLPANAEFRLNVVGHYTSPLATTRWARLLPEQILRAAGLPLASTSPRTVNLRYRAFTGMRLLAERIFPLTFGPADATTQGVLAPIVPPVISGPTIPISYDLTRARNVSSPRLLISEPGRMNPATGFIYHPPITMPLSQLRGTVNVPVRSLQGGGIYGIGILYGHFSGNCTDPVGNPSPCPLYSDFAYTRVAGESSARPPAPLLSSDGSFPSHALFGVSYGGRFTVSWDASNVPGATGALLEISAAGLTPYFSFNMFNNPNGNRPDNNGVDSGHVSVISLGGTKGTTTIDAARAHLVPTLNHVVRIIPMKGQSVAGEAGDVSTVEMDGVAMTGGLPVNNGFGVNPVGNDGYVLSNEFVFGGPNIQTIDSVQSFDQRSNQIFNVDVPPTSSYTFGTLTGGMEAGDVTALIRDALGATETGHISMKIRTGAFFGFDAPKRIIYNALNGVTNTTAFIGDNYDLANSKLPPADYVVAGNVAADTFGKPIKVFSPTPSWPYFVDLGQAQDYKTNLFVYDNENVTLPNFNFCEPAVLRTVNLNTGAQGKFTGPGKGIFGMAIDSATHKLAYMTDCDSGLGIVDPRTKSGIHVTLPLGPYAGPVRYSGLYMAADPVHRLFLVWQFVPPEVFVDNNALSSVLVYNENGVLLSKIRHFAFFGSFQIGYNGLQINPNTRRGYMFGLINSQLQPFSY